MRSRANVYVSTAEREAAYKRGAGRPPAPPSAGTLRDDLVRAAVAATEARVAARVAAIAAERARAARAAEGVRRVKAAQAVLLQQVGGRRINAAAPSDLTRKDAKRLFRETYAAVRREHQSKLEIAVMVAFDGLTPAPSTVKDALEKIRRQVSGQKRPATPDQFDRVADAVPDTDEVAFATLTWDLAVAADFDSEAKATDALCDWLQEFAAEQSA